MKLLVYLTLSIGLMLAAACGGAPAMPVDSTPDTAPLPSTPVPVEVTDIPVTPHVRDTPSPTAQKLVDLSRENLSGTLKIGIDEIETIGVEAVIWPDASLGCPKSGVAYIQVLTPGFLVRLDVNGQQYQYHTDKGETVILCAEDAFPVFPLTPGDIQDGVPWVPVN